MNDYAKEVKDTINLIASVIDSDTPIMDRRLPTAKGDRGGRVTRLPQCVWLHYIFELNEIYACKGQLELVLHENQIKHNWSLEFGNKPRKKGNVYRAGNAIESGNQAVGSYRNKYRKGVLFTGQLKPILMSFRYSYNKHICQDGKNRKFYTHNECREHALKYKIADPRFFTREEIAEIKRHAEQKGEILSWGIPSERQWKSLDEVTPGGIFRSIRTKTPWT